MRSAVILFYIERIFVRFFAGMGAMSIKKSDSRKRLSCLTEMTNLDKDPLNFCQFNAKQSVRHAFVWLYETKRLYLQMIKTRNIQ
jgi:hypothetical protein